jgi:hypothetical protein
MSSVETSVQAPPDPSAAARHLFQIALGFIPAAALHVAARLDLAERLAGGPRTVADLAAEAGVGPDPLYRVLRALASVGIFAETAPRTFASTPPADLLRKGEGSLGDGIQFMTDALHFQAYGDMLHTVQTGEPSAEKAVGMPLFDYLARTPEWSASFNNAMTAFSASVMPAVLEAYDFSGITRLVDVAGGHGRVLSAVLQAYPAMQGVLFDVDHVIAGAAPLLAAAGVAERCRTEAGDFFTAVPAGGDAYIMKHIIHDWEDDRALTILKNIRRAIAPVPGARLILLEAVVSPANEPDMGKLIDLEMMLFPRGRERTADEFATLFARGGFTLTRVVRTASMLSVVEGTPA